MNDSSRLDPRIEEAMAEWARQVEAGLPVDLPQFVAGYPEVAAELRQAIEFEAKLGRACRQLGAPGPVHSLASGSVFAGYHVVREIGRGGMGVVYETWQSSLSRRVALKLLSPALGTSERERQRFLTEARIVALLDHEHIVQVHEAGEHDGIPYFAMQFIDGESLAQVLAREREELTQDENAYVRRIAEYGAQAAEALAEAHARGVIHRDVKPSNLLVAGERLWITDFGLARARDLTEGLSSHRPAGTVRYMSPEQFAGTALPFDGRGDVYSLGVTLYELLTLRHPGVDWSAKEPVPLRQHRAAVPMELETVVLKAMAWEVGDRYAGAKELAEELRRWLNGEPVKAQPWTRWQRVRRVLWRRRRVLSVVGVALLMGLFGGLAIGGIGLFHAYQTEVGLRKDAQQQRRISLDAVRELARMVILHVRHIPGKASEEKVVLEKALRLVEEAAEQAPPDHELHVEVAILTSWMINAEHRVGNDTGLHKYRRLAEARLRRLVEAFPDKEEARLELAKVLTWGLGDLGLPEQEAILSEVLGHVRALLAKKPTKPEYLEREAAALLLWGNALHYAGLYREALEKTKPALATCEALCRRFPSGHPLSYQRLALVWSRLAATYEELGDLQAAEHAYHQCIAMDRRLAEEYPEVLTHREATLRQAAALAVFLHRHGRNREARTYAEKYVEPMTRGLERHPELKAFREGLLELCFLRGVLAYEGDEPGARAAFARAVELFRGGKWEPWLVRYWLLHLLQIPDADVLPLGEWGRLIEDTPGWSEQERRLLRGLAAFRAGRDGEAKELLGASSTMEGYQGMAAKFALAVLHARAGEKEKAQALLAKVERDAGPLAALVVRLVQLEARQAVAGLNR